MLSLEGNELLGTCTLCSPDLLLICSEPSTSVLYVTVVEYAEIVKGKALWSRHWLISRNPVGEIMSSATFPLDFMVTVRTVAGCATPGPL